LDDSGIQPAKLPPNLLYLKSFNFNCTSWRTTQNVLEYLSAPAVLRTGILYMDFPGDSLINTIIDHNSRTQQPNGVYLYTDTNFQGASLTLGDCDASQSYNVNLSNTALYNQASSLIVRGNCQAAVFTDSNCSSSKHTYAFLDDDFDDEGINDSAKCVIVTGLTDSQRNGVYLYENVAMSGNYIHLQENEPNFGTLNFNDTASSFRIIGSYNVTLWQNYNYSGSAVTYSNPTVGDMRELITFNSASVAASTNWNDMVSSLQLSAK
jgi:hypothetical protein